ncbi:MAG: hypothetical protein LBK95_11205 [Bifidobacteriaceae bacterium]|nr:hypothetical protein [Bifidobacteriaceae bacterium]
MEAIVHQDQGGHLGRGGALLAAILVIILVVGVTVTSQRKREAAEEASAKAVKDKWVELQGLIKTGRGLSDAAPASFDDLGVLDGLP